MVIRYFPASTVGVARMNAEASTMFLSGQWSTERVTPGAYDHMVFPTDWDGMEQFRFNSEGHTHVRRKQMQSRWNGNQVVSRKHQYRQRSHKGMSFIFGEKSASPNNKATWVPERSSTQPDLRVRHSLVLGHTSPGIISPHCSTYTPFSLIVGLTEW